MPDIRNDEKRIAKREYYREWRRNNPERVAQIQERFWHKKAAEMRSNSAADQAKGEGQNGEH